MPAQSCRLLGLRLRALVAQALARAGQQDGVDGLGAMASWAEASPRGQGGAPSGRRRRHGMARWRKRPRGRPCWACPGLWGSRRRSPAESRRTSSPQAARLRHASRLRRLLRTPWAAMPAPRAGLPPVAPKPLRRACAVRSPSFPARRPCRPRRWGCSPQVAGGGAIRKASSWPPRPSRTSSSRAVPLSSSP